MFSVFGPVASGIFQVLGPNIPKQRTKTITILIVHMGVSENSVPLFTQWFC